MEKASKLRSRDRYSSPQVIAHLDAQLQDRQRQLQVHAIYIRARTHTRSADWHAEEGRLRRKRFWDPKSVPRVFK